MSRKIRQVLMFTLLIVLAGVTFSVVFLQTRVFEGQGEMDLTYGWILQATEDCVIQSHDQDYFVLVHQSGQYLLSASPPIPWEARCFVANGELKQGESVLIGGMTLTSSSCRLLIYPSADTRTLWIVLIVIIGGLLEGALMLFVHDSKPQ